ncbi:MAG: RluA family pseudouridine synthase [Candidatus Liberibacter ctenarytainae]|uniref:Pseudouridine synthase n=1 Tax=Candidatus Liberibacter ctenarytainae TaxID=2020335 RepID=A0A937AQ55_9HYPH|nr:RluA family pseudouridine synthase [Candidatus Liberibacter ctenarytainae]
MPLMVCVKNVIIDSDEDNMRFDRWFKAHYPQIGFGNLQKLLRSGQIRVDKKRVKSNDRVQSGQCVRIPPIVNTVNYQNREKYVIDSSKGYLDRSAFLKHILLYEDSKIYIFNKPAGMAVQGGSGITYHMDGILESWLDSQGRKPRLIHRLDQETSGILVVARTRAAAQNLTESFRMRRVKKIYWSLVQGIPDNKKGCIANWLVKTGKVGGDHVKVVDQNEKGARYAISHFKVIDAFAQNFCWLEMQPYTGRTHQLRIHALHMGNPIVGDKKYFTHNPKENDFKGIQNKLYLHARFMDFPHPEGGRMQVVAPLPTHMDQTWSSLGFKYNTDTYAKRI